MLPLEHEFGWSAATISAAVALNIALFGICGPFAAAAMQRFGLRRVVAASLLINGVSIAATVAVKAPWQLVLLWGVCVGLGTGLTANVLAATVATRWFIKSRGVVVGLLSASLSTGQLIFLPLLAAVATAHGWRWAIWIVAGCLAAAAIPVLLLLRDWPSDVGQPAYGGTHVELPPVSHANPIVTAMNELREAAGARDFQLLFATFFVCGASTAGLIATHFIPACGDHNIGEVQAAGYLAAMGALDLVGTTASGYLSDRYDARVLLFWYYGLRGAALLCLPAALVGGRAGAVGLHRVLRPGLDRDDPADPEADECRLRHPAGAAALRLDRGRAPDRGQPGCPLRGAGAHRVRSLRFQLLGIGRAVHPRRPDGAGDRPAPYRHRGAGGRDVASPFAICRIGSRTFSNKAEGDGHLRRLVTSTMKTVQRVASLLTLALLIPGIAAAAAKPFTGPAGWEQSETPGTAPKIKQSWKNNGQQINFIYDGELKYEDVISMIKTNVSTNNIPTSINLERKCDGKPAYEVAMVFGKSYIRQIIIDESPGVAKITYVRPDDAQTPTDVTGAVSGYCGA